MAKKNCAFGAHLSNGMKTGIVGFIIGVGVRTAMKMRKKAPPKSTGK